jgi:hypothetical protein
MPDRASGIAGIKETERMITLRKFGIGLVVLLTLSLSLLSLFRGKPSAAQGRGAAIPRKWEYKQIVASGPDFALNINDFNALGAEGWELCSSTTTPGGMHMFFKRPKP